MTRSLNDAMSNLKAGSTLISEAVEQMAAIIGGTTLSISRLRRLATQTNERPAQAAGNGTGLTGRKLLSGGDKARATSIMKKLKAWRIMHKMTQRAMCDDIGIGGHNAALGHWECGRTFPNREHYNALRTFAQANGLI